MSEKIKIQIKCKHVVEYSQYKEVTQEEYDKLMELNDEFSVTGNDFHFVEQFIDPTDIVDSEMEYTDLEISEDND